MDLDGFGWMNGKRDGYELKQILQDVPRRFQMIRIWVFGVQLFQPFWMLDIFHNKMLENNVHSKEAGCLVPGNHAQDGKNGTLIIQF